MTIAALIAAILALLTAIGAAAGRWLKSDRNRVRTETIRQANENTKKEGAKLEAGDKAAAETAKAESEAITAAAEAELSEVGKDDAAEYLRRSRERAGRK